MLGQRGGRLVEHQQLRVERERLDDLDDLLLRRREVADERLGAEVRDADLLESSRVCRSIARMSTRPRFVGSRFTKTFSATVRSGQEVELLEDDRHARALRLHGVRERDRLALQLDRAPSAA